jgi:hypothetical protein
MLHVASAQGKKDSSRAARPLRPPPKPRELRPAYRAGAASDSSSDEDEPPSEVLTQQTCQHSLWLGSCTVALRWLLRTTLSTSVFAAGVRRV